MVDGGQETRGSSYLLLLPAFALVYLAIATAVLLSLAQTYSFLLNDPHKPAPTPNQKNKEIHGDFCSFRFSFFFLFSCGRNRTNTHVPPKYYYSYKKNQCQGRA